MNGLEKKTCLETKKKILRETLPGGRPGKNTTKLEYNDIRARL